ncbi:MAG: HD domain-containing protein [Oscillospiraceae bacterium]|nr:HD domain-containing protein [Oscillospiraceae bacterium]
MTEAALVRALASAVAAAGGRAYFVGGYVRDRLMGRENKDMDVEVYGLYPSALEEILSSLGEVITKGLSFGVYGLRHYDIDIAMPRRETALGRGHRDFQIDVDPFLSCEQAARRRDFTVNAMLEDVLTGEVLDFYGGQEDLRRGVLRRLSSESFGEDPLRVLRAAQFAARFGFTVEEETAALCRGIDLSALPGERVMGELEKALLKSERPSVFFEVLRSVDQLGGFFPELRSLIDLPQSPRFHPEGDVWTHTMAVLDTAAAFREQAKEPLPFLLSALCHDLGKAVTTAYLKGDYHAYDHERAGQALAESFLSRLTSEKALLAYVKNQTLEHMRPNKMAQQGSARKNWNRLFDESVCPEDLLLLAKADYLGCGGCTEADFKPIEARSRQALSEYREDMAKPYVMGRDLLEAGITPGEGYGELLSFAHKLRLAGVEKEQALRQVLAMARKAAKTQKQ